MEQIRNPWKFDKGVKITPWTKDSFSPSDFHFAGKFPLVDGWVIWQTYV